MEISAVTLSLPKPPPSLYLPVSSSNSSFFSTTTRTNFTSLVQVRPRTRTEPAKRNLTCNALFGLGVPELAVIAGVAALVFGPKKLPEIGKSLGKSVRSFQQAAKEFESELKKEPDTVMETSSESPTATVSVDEKQEIKVSSSTENV